MEEPIHVESVNLELFNVILKCFMLLGFQTMNVRTICSGKENEIVILRLER
jgi:hypothetical protein